MKKIKYVVYCRKSTDTEDRQIHSIEDQENTLSDLTKKMGLDVVEFFGESMSAKKPGRPEFIKMINLIKSGKANGIICWSLNRLARNPVDAGDVQWLLQKNIIESIVTPSREYLPTDNIIMMAVELGMANQFVLDLSKDVKRGMSSKVDKGWRPCKAPIGYVNDYTGLKGEKKIFIDKDRFDTIRKMWDLLLSKECPVLEILDVATNKWGLRQANGLKLGLTATYKIFTNKFYYGEFDWNGETFKGNHKPMITEEEYDRVQKILGKRGKPRPRYKRLPFNGVIECAECGGMITCEEKSKKLKSTGKYKSYIFHRCSKRKKNKKCFQKPITNSELEVQIINYLNSITLPKEFLNWSLNVLKENNQLEESRKSTQITIHKNNLKNCNAKIDNIIQLFISPDNMNKRLLSEEDYIKQKNDLNKEKGSIEAEIKQINNHGDKWLELTQNTFEFATYAKHWFKQGNYEKKTTILKSLGKKHLFKDKKLTIQLQEPLQIIKKHLLKDVNGIARLEPTISTINKQKNNQNMVEISNWSG
jgi:site-specific DNA recombinase